MCVPGGGEGEVEKDHGWRHRARGEGSLTLSWRVMKR